MKTLIILSAIPASGKSTWAAQYQATHPNVYIVSSDAIRMEITGGDYQDHTKQKQVWELFSKRIHEYANKGDDVNVILDALCDLNSLRESYVKDNPEYDTEKNSVNQTYEEYLPLEAVGSLVTEFESLGRSHVLVEHDEERKTVHDAKHDGRNNQEAECRNHHNVQESLKEEVAAHTTTIDGVEDECRIDD